MFNPQAEEKKFYHSIEKFEGVLRPHAHVSIKGRYLKDLASRKEIDHET